MRTFIFTFLTLTLLLLTTACNQKKNLSTSESTSSVTNTSQNAKTEAAESKMTYNNDCFSDRAVTKEVTDKEVSMTKVMNMFMFSYDSTRWQACEVPTEYQKEGMKVKVSGQVLEIRPNERRAGTPFNITSIKKIQ